MRNGLHGQRGIAGGGAAALRLAWVVWTMWCGLVLGGGPEHEVSFKSRTYTDPEQGSISLPRVSESYVKFEVAGKGRPLFAGGWGKEGTIRLKTTVVDKVVLVESWGTGVVEFTEWAGAAGAEAIGFACGEWAKGERAVEVKITRISGWKESGEAMVRFLDVIAPPAKGAPPAPTPVFEAAADLEIRDGARMAVVPGVPVRVEFTLNVEQLWSFRRVYWLMTIMGAGHFRGSDVGLSGADAGEVRFEMVAAGLKPVDSVKSVLEGAALDADETRGEAP